MNNVRFHPERDSSSLFITVRGHKDLKGLRDRDFLLDSEVDRIRKAYPNLYVLRYYCFENYLYHPDNLASMGLNGFDREIYIDSILAQKNDKIFSIISNYKSARKSYAEFKIERERIEQKKREEDVVVSLRSDVFEEFYKFFSMKDHFNKSIIESYNISQESLAQTSWFKDKMREILPFLASEV